jgi:predicted TIM-barrel fold metal-dependent hydrolase
MIIDAQIHLWEADRPDRPWPVGRSNFDRTSSYSADQMIKEMDAIGVDRAVVVPPSWIGEDNSTALEAAAKYPDRFAVMGRFDPTADGAPERLETWLDQPHMLGIRMTFLNAFAEWLEPGSPIEWFWADCERLNIPIMVLVHGVTEKVIPIAARHPGLKLIIDHMAADIRLKGAPAFSDIDYVAALARYPEVRVKVSSAPCFSNDPYPFKDIEPFLRRLYDAYGARRLMWGADLAPRLTSTYLECLNHFREGLPFLKESDKEWILGKATAKALNWPG